MLIPRIAAFSARFRRTVLAGWLAVVLAGAASAPVLFERLSSEVGSIDGSESARAAQLMWEADPSGEQLVAVADGRSADDPALLRRVDAVAQRVAALPGVEAVVTPWSADGPGRQAVATDGWAVAVVVSMTDTPDGWSSVDEVAEALRSVDAPHVLVGGGPVLDEEMEAQAASDLKRAELLSMPVVLLLLVVVFAGVIAAGLPVVIALVGICATMGMLALLSAVTDVSVYAVNIVTMLGLGLAVDYALLVVSRFREERTPGRGLGSDAGCDAAVDVAAALARTYASAGRTVAFSGLVVAASLAGLLAFEDDFLRSMGLAGLLVVLLDLLAAVTLLPALLATVGHRLRPAASGDGRLFLRITTAVRRRPVIVAVVTAVPLLLAAGPFLGVRYADPTASSLPETSASRQLAELAEFRFPAVSGADPISVVATGAVAPAALHAYVDAVSALPGVEAVSVRSGMPGLTVVDVVPAGETQGREAMHLVEVLRALPAPADVLLAGDAASLSDYQASLADRLPWALAVVVLSSFVLLFLFTGSLVIPLKAVLLNALSLGVSLGALVWVFLEGHLGGLVGTEALGSLSVTTPVLVAAIAFGLSMDYEVFLLGRIAEAYRAGADAGRAIDRGLQRTGSVVTAAALLMVVVFAGFVAGGFSPVKQVGLGLVVAIAVDATLIRMLLLPAVMQLLGERCWWAPPALRRLHGRIGLHDEPACVPPLVRPMLPGQLRPTEELATTRR